MQIKFKEFNNGFTVHSPVISQLSAVAVIFFFIFACSRNDITADPSCRLSFSVDTVQFDTIFTGFGSATRRLTVYNPDKRTVRTDIRLAGGSNSPFRINIDGLPAASAENVEIAGRDSLYIFIEITADQQNSDLPVIVCDSILFETNGNRQHVRMEARAQDVFVLRSETVGNVIWSGQKPYLIYGILTVDTLKTLYISAGVHVYFHRDAGIHVKGSLTAEGTATQPVIFTGDRLEKMYRNIPGQWGSIVFGTASRDNLLRHVEIRNGTNGVIFGNPQYIQTPAITLDAAVITNMSNAGIMAFSADVRAVNCLVANCVSHTVALFCGGTARFVYCTVANNYSPYVYRKNTAAFTVSQKYLNMEGKIPGNVFVGNSIVYGTLSNEIDLDGADTFTFDRCLLRTAMNTATSGFVNVRVNMDPLFAETAAGNFRLKKDSPARDAGDSSIEPSVTEDIAGNSRIIGRAPDLGAYEYNK